MDRVRLCSSIRKEYSWYPIVPYDSLGVTILQMLDRLPLVLRLMKRMMELCIIILRENINKVIRKARRMLWKISRIILKKIKIGLG